MAVAADIPLTGRGSRQPSSRAQRSSAWSVALRSPRPTTAPAPTGRRPTARPPPTGHRGRATRGRATAPRTTRATAATAMTAGTATARTATARTATARAPTSTRHRSTRHPRIPVRSTPAPVGAAPRRRVAVRPRVRRPSRRAADRRGDRASRPGHGIRRTPGRGGRRTLAGRHRRGPRPGPRAALEPVPARQRGQPGERPGRVLDPGLARDPGTGRAGRAGAAAHRWTVRPHAAWRTSSPPATTAASTSSPIAGTIPIEAPTEPGRRRNRSTTAAKRPTPRPPPLRWCWSTRPAARSWSRAGVGFDPGGIGKGFAADLVLDELLAEGAGGACVNLGGDVRVGGLGPDGGDWTVTVEDPRDPAGPPLVTLLLADGAVATSSRCRRRWRARRRHARRTT